MPKDTLRILYLTTFYPTKDREHHGIFFRDHAQAASTTYSTAVLHLGVKSIQQLILEKQKSEYFWDHDVFTMHQFGTVPSHRFTDLTQKKLYKITLKAFEKLKSLWGIPDIIIAQCSLPAGLLSLHLHHKYGIKYGIIEHFSFLSEQIKQQQIEMRPVYEKACFVATVNSNLKSVIEQNFDISVDLVSNVIGSEFMRDEIPKSNRFKWLHISYDDPKKGTGLLHQLLKTRPEIPITLVGTGLKKYVLPENTMVTVIESASRSEIVKLLKEHHALLSLSKTETFGMSIVEALASGKPVLATKSGGPETYWEKEFGILCEQTLDSVIEGIQFIEGHYDEFNSESISSSILSKFGTSSYCNQLENLIHRCK